MKQVSLEPSAHETVDPDYGLTLKSNLSSSSSLMIWTASSHSGKSPFSIASLRSRRW